MKSRLDNAGGAFVLIGLGVIFLLGLGFWPWILFVVAVPTLLSGLSSGKPWDGVQGAVWLVGFGVIALLGIWWPGILILAGISILIGMIEPPQLLGGRRKRKPKRGLPLPDDEDEWR